MSEKKYYIQPWMRINVEEDEVFTLERAKSELYHCREMQPEDIFHIVDQEGEIVELENKILDYFTSKEAEVVFVNCEHTTWWFKIDGGRVLAIDYLPLNHPQLEIHIFPTIKYAIERKKEMVNDEGWEVERDRLEED